MRPFAQSDKSAVTDAIRDKNAEKGEAKLIPAMPGPVKPKLPRIAIIGRISHIGGVQAVILALIKGLNARDIIPDVVWDLPPNPKLLDEKGLQAGYVPLHFPVSSQLLDRLPVSARYILRTADFYTSSQLASHAYDFYYIFYNGFLVNDGTPHVNYLNGPPLIPRLEVISPGLRGVPFRALNWVYRHWLSKRFPVYEFHPGSPYVINADYTAELFEEAHEVRLPVVYPPINLSGRSFTAEDLAGRDAITYFSRFADYKRPEMVLKLAACYPQERFVLMGGVKNVTRAYFESLHQSAQADGLNNVTFIDNPSDARVQEELSRTRFYIFPAVNEHFGMTTAEAIGSGTIPFVHDSGGQREIVPDPRLRFTDASFFDQFAALLRMPPTELNQIRFRLREHVNRYSEEAFIQKMLGFIDNL